VRANPVFALFCFWEIIRFLLKTKGQKPKTENWKPYLKDQGYAAIPSLFVTR